MGCQNMDKKENKIGFIVFVFSCLICVIATGYAIWSHIYQGKAENKMNTATLILTLNESTSEGISLLNAVPVSDAKAASYKPYEFTLKNSGTSDANYKILLTDDADKYVSHGCQNQKLTWSNIKYSISSGNDVTTVGNLGEVNGILEEGTLPRNSSKNYSLRLWIKSEATNEIMNHHFHGLIKVESVQSN